MEWNKEYLDLVLVPSGMLIMFGYHIFFLYRYLTDYKSTSIGFEDHSKRAWVKGMMQIVAERRGPAFTVMDNTIKAVTYMASTSLAIASLIGAWIGSTSGNSLFTKIIYGDTRISFTSMKYISVLLFFLIAFASFVQCLRSYVNANFLLSMPKATDHEDLVVEALIHGSNFWHVGLRLIYFAITLLVWEPLQNFHELQEKMLKKVEEEIRAVTRVIGHHGSPHAGEVRKSVTTAKISTSPTS